jgi:undecaprenyl-diphosphatase
MPKPTDIPVLSRLWAAWQWLRRREIATVVSLFVVVGGAWAFVELADEVLEGDTQSFDERAMRALSVEGGESDAPVGPKWLRNGARDITALGGLPVLALIVAGVTGLLLLLKDYAAAILVAATTICGALVGLALKAIFDRPRPDIFERLDEVFTSSFPSGHSMMSAIVYLTLGVLLASFVKQRKLKTYFIGVAVLLTFLVGVSRVYAGVHYPTDVLAGWTAGLVWAAFCGLVASVVKKMSHDDMTVSVESTRDKV